MPTSAADDAYAEWLATPPVTGQYVETLEFTGGVAGSGIRICNRRRVALQALDEDGVPRTFSPLPFTITKPAIRNSSEMRVDARIDALDGTLMRVLVAARSVALNQPVAVALRAYIDPTILDRPVWRVPFRFRVESIRATLDVIEVVMVGGRLPNKRAGLYYGIDRFVGLRPF
jgi:hypothetical protein